MVGNFFEMEESLDCLEGHGPADLMEVTLRLSAWMLVAGGKAKTVEEGIAMCETALASGRPRELFLSNLARQGGDLAKFESLRGNYRSKFRSELRAPAEGFIQSIDAYKIGVAGVYLGVGRDKTTDPVYPDVGFVFRRKAGDRVGKGEVVAEVYGKDAASLEAARSLVESSLSIGPAKAQHRPLIVKEITAL